MEPLYDPLRQGERGEPSRRNFTLHDLQPLTPYAFRLYAWNSRGRSRGSELARVTTRAPDATISSAVPLAGPVHGGTRLRISGSDFAFGSVYRCRFGEHVVPATLVADEPPARAASPEDAPRVDAAAFDRDEAAERPSALRAVGGRRRIECVTPAAVRSFSNRPRDRASADARLGPVGAGRSVRAVGAGAGAHMRWHHAHPSCVGTCRCAREPAGPTETTWHSPRTRCLYTSLSMGRRQRLRAVAMARGYESRRWSTRCVSS